jgi:spermidine/putrescine transport system substrate-binding protein
MKMKLMTVTLAALAACLSGCGSKSSAPTLNLYAWSEYVPQGVIDAFTAETGIKVNYETYASNEEMLAKLQSRVVAYDLVQPSEYAVEILARQNMLLPLNWDNIPNFKNIAQEFKNLPHDPEQKYSVPWMVGTVGIVVNTDVVKEPVRGYRDVFSGKYRGRIVILDDSREIVSWALATEKLPINDVGPAALARIAPVLKNWLPQVKVYDSDSPKTALLNGDVDLGIVWSGEAAILFQENPKFAYVLPEEGAHMFMDSLCVPATSKNKEAAEQFINFILRPEISKMISDDFPYTNPNTAARMLLSPEQLANPASYPPGDPKLETFRDIGAAGKDIDKLVTDIRSGL